MEHEQRMTHARGRSHVRLSFTLGWYAWLILPLLGFASGLVGGYFSNMLFSGRGSADHARRSPNADVHAEDLLDRINRQNEGMSKRLDAFSDRLDRLEKAIDTDGERLDAVGRRGP